MKRAIISDIHSNLEALQAVMEDIEAQKVDEIFCLGDVIGYGANPIECLDIVRKRCKVCLLGNHDQGALFDPEGFNGSAESAIFWTRSQLEAPSPQRDERWDFLNMRPRFYRDPDLGAIFVHGSPKNPLNEYVFPEDIYNPPKMDPLFNLVIRLSFQGHTHVPGIFTEDRRFFAPIEFGMERVLQPQKKYLINVGSVGQPRDNNPDACYLILESDPEQVLVRYRRIKYPVEIAMKKIHDVPQLDNFLGDRLRSGR